MVQGVDAHFEARGHPVDEGDGFVRPEQSDGCHCIFGHDVSPVQQTDRHVLADLLIDGCEGCRGSEDGCSDLLGGGVLVDCLFGREERRVGHGQEVDARIRHEVCAHLADG